MYGMSVMLKPASGMCNLKCDYCFYCDEAQKREQDNYGFMSEDTLRNIIRKTLLNVDNNITYAYQGGEPLLRGIDFFEKAMEYQHKYNKNNIAVNNALQTNACLINEEWCKFFKKNNFLIGVSVDGTELTHNKYRHTKDGKDTYKTVLKATELLNEYEVDYNILTVVNKGIAENISEIYDEYRRNGWGFQQYIACLDPFGEEHGKNEYALTPKLYGEFLIKLFDMWYKDLKISKQPFIRQFENFIAIILGYYPESCEQCGKCGYQNAVEANGNVYPCDFYMFDDYLLGNFNTNRLLEIDEKRKEIGFIEKSIPKSKECMACRYFMLCKGGCQRNKDYNTETGEYEFYFCESYKMFFENSLEKIMEAVKIYQKRIDEAHKH